MQIVVTGSVAFDYLMSFPGYFRDHILPDRLESISLSFLVDSMVRLRGGVAPNIAYTLALLGQRPLLWATVGKDFLEYRQLLEQAGVDTSGAIEIEGEYTASFFANTDKDNNQIASFYPGAMSYASRYSLSCLEERPDFVVISPNDPEAMRLFVRECRQYHIPYLYDPSQQIVRLTKQDIIEGIEGCQALFVNDYESALIANLTGYSPDQLVKRREAPKGVFVVVTRGQHGADIYNEETEIHIPVVFPHRIIDPTGVGDAFRGGFLTGYSNQFSLSTCGRMGALAATYCLEQHGPQGYHFTVDEFKHRFKENFPDDLEIDGLSTGDI
jgi:adenosine kinase